jgi:hypothetical protein
MALAFVYRSFHAMRIPMETEPVSPENGCGIKRKNRASQPEDDRKARGI